jgi:hypothetical protein
MCSVHKKLGCADLCGDVHQGVPAHHRELGNKPLAYGKFGNATIGGRSLYFLCTQMYIWGMWGCKLNLRRLFPYLSGIVVSDRPKV